MSRGAKLMTSLATEVYTIPHHNDTNGQEQPWWSSYLHLKDLHGYSEQLSLTICGMLIKNFLGDSESLTSLLFLTLSLTSPKGIFY